MGLSIFSVFEFAYDTLVHLLRISQDKEIRKRKIYAGLIIENQTK